MCQCRSRKFVDIKFPSQKGNTRLDTGEKCQMGYELWAVRCIVIFGLLLFIFGCTRFGFPIETTIKI